MFLIVTLVLRVTYINMTGGDPYNHMEGGLDTYGYEALAVTYQYSSYADYLSYLTRYIKFGIDDFGFTTVMWCLMTTIHDIVVVRYLLLIINALFVSSSAVMIFKLCHQCLFIDRKLAMFAAYAYGLFPFLMFSSSVGLKENTFMYLCVSAWYYMYRWKKNPSVLRLLVAQIFLWSTILFRTGVTLIYLVSFIVLAYCNEWNKKKAVKLGLVAGGLMLGFMPVIIALFGQDIQFIMRVTEGRLGGATDNLQFGYLVQVISGLMGPFPNFSHYDLGGMIHASGLVLKVLLAFYLYYGFYISIKRYEYMFFPFMTCVLASFVMYVVCGIALDMRYQITAFPAFILIAAKGLQVYKGKKLYFQLYVLLIIVVIFYYQLR